MGVAGRGVKLGVEWVRVLASLICSSLSPGSFQPSAGSAETWSECHLSAYSPAAQPSPASLPGFPGSFCPPAYTTKNNIRLRLTTQRKVT